MPGLEFCFWIQLWSWKDDFVSCDTLTEIIIALYCLTVSKISNGFITHSLKEWHPIEESPFTGRQKQKPKSRKQGCGLHLHPSPSSQTGQCPLWLSELQLPDFMELMFQTLATQGRSDGQILAGVGPADWFLLQDVLWLWGTGYTEGKETMIQMKEI